jgi:hypothetical protein
MKIVSPFTNNMNTLISTQNILQSIQHFSPEEKALLFKQLQEDLQENENPSNSVIASENPWITLAGKYENDPQYEQVLAYIEQYRSEIDAETES